jgi:hypothetical protein
MTTKQTIKALRKSGKPISLTHLYRLLTLLNIKPLGRSRPQQYPADTADKILTHLGLSPAVTSAPPSKPVLQRQQKNRPQANHFTARANGRFERLP